MHPHLVERMATARHAELALLAQAGDGARRYRRARAAAAGEAVHGWRLRRLAPRRRRPG
ncbi:MAG TPA: hypothetical protein VHF24_13920 [Acidimicrobiales bacterium]|nr:hypothetical protein [Acidimicrobiales bacterium]